MKKAQKKLTLHRDTVRKLEISALQDLAGGTILTAKCATILCTVTCITRCGNGTQAAQCTIAC
jgi:hypothetical protein